MNKTITALLFTLLLTLQGCGGAKDSTDTMMDVFSFSNDISSPAPEFVTYQLDVLANDRLPSDLSTINLTLGSDANEAEGATFSVVTPEDGLPYVEMVIEPSYNFEADFTYKLKVEDTFSVSHVMVRFLGFSGPPWAGLNFLRLEPGATKFANSFDNSAFSVVGGISNDDINSNIMWGEYADSGVTFNYPTDQDVMGDFSITASEDGVHEMIVAGTGIGVLDTDIQNYNLFAVLTDQSKDLVSLYTHANKGDHSGTFLFRNTSRTINEDIGVIKIPAIRVGNGTGKASATLAISTKSTVTPGEDIAGDGFYTLTWDDGERGVKYFTIEILQDGVEEGVESASFELTSEDMITPYAYELFQYTGSFAITDY